VTIHRRYVCVRWQNLSKIRCRFFHLPRAARVLFDSTVASSATAGVSHGGHGGCSREQVREGAPPAGGHRGQRNACLPLAAADKPISTASGRRSRHREGWRSRGRGDQPHSGGARRMVVRATLDRVYDGPWVIVASRMPGSASAGRGGPPVRGVLHTKAGWAGYGPIDQALPFTSLTQRREGA